MKKAVKGRVFGRERKGRVALMRGLAENLIVHGKIHTTEAKAKELRPYVERLVTFAKKDTIASRRLLSSRLGGRAATVKKLFADIAPKYKDRKGGYTRIIKTGVRKADSARQAVIEFI